MIFRQAQPTDAIDLIPLLRQLGYDELDERQVNEKILQYSAPDYTVLVAEVNQRLIGFIALHTYEIFHVRGKAGRIVAFCVDQNFRSQGVGVSLMREAESYFVSNGCARIEVTSNKRRAETHNFYLNRGYLDESKKFVRYL